jgi:hypothetical protein
MLSQLVAELQTYIKSIAGHQYYSITYTNSHYSGFHAICGHHYEIIIQRHIHSSGFHGN